MAKAQKGDLIRIVSVPKDWSYGIGGIYEVISISKDGYPRFYIDDTEEVYYAYPGQYEIHRKAGEESEQDTVNSPQHYSQGRFETIEIIEEITQGYDDGYIAYCIGNALKYLARAPFKHGVPTEDIGKAAKYIEFALARLQTQE
ncbi:DUF3310 domain-containing protein [Lysinibacillus sp. NPDC097162]|uniref:DUF3310 domain-containing protein n=1 Tax=Lysinibacillus sp. NPDC097162 TaxID=3364140 RepID=UPI003828BB5A